MRKRYRVALLVLGAFFGFWPTGAVQAQNADLNLNDDLYHFFDRLDIKGVTRQAMPTDLKPFPREVAAQWLRAADTAQLSHLDRQWLMRAQFLVDDSLCRDMADVLLKFLYRNRRDFLHYKGDKFRVYLNPVLGFSVGYDRNNYAAGNQLTYQNSRGGSLRGTLFGIVGFYTEVTDNQVRYPQYVSEFHKAQGNLFGEGYIKTFGDNGYDFFNGRGYLTVTPVKGLRIKLGRDRAYWGNGFQSLLLSDHATDYNMFSIHYRIWKLDYMTQFTEFVDFIPRKPDNVGTYPRKYGAFHQLTFRPIPQLSFSLFESTVYATELANGRRGFELQYLNPLIFYRSIEQYIGSPDNSTLGLQAKANILKRFQLYGQLMIDDLNLGQRKNGPGWVGNKVGWQAGLKWIDVLGIPMLDLQLEYNRLRPYMYNHFNPSSNYAHYGQPLAHSRGANLQDFTAIVRYQPLNRLNLSLRYTYTAQGLDSTGRNFGSNIYLPSGTANNGTDNPDFNNTVGQGVPLRLHMLQARATYQLWNWNAYADLEATYRRENEFDTFAILLGVRLNMAIKPIKF